MALPMHPLFSPALVSRLSLLSPDQLAQPLSSPPHVVRLPFLSPAQLADLWSSPQHVSQQAHGVVSPPPNLSQLPLLSPPPLLGLPHTCYRVRELEAALIRAHGARARMAVAGDLFDEEDLAAADGAIATAQSALEEHARTFQLSAALAVAAGFAERVHARGLLLHALSAAGAPTELEAHLTSKQVRLAFQASEMLRLATAAE